MCGRFTLTSEIKELQEHFAAGGQFSHHPSYNIAPSREVPTVRSAESGREIIPCHWGLIPHWSKSGSPFKAINARAETLATKPFFRDAFRKRRCLIPANGFFEWKKQNRHKQPYYFQLEDNKLMGFAGLWEYWEGEQKRIESCTIITTKANDVMKQVHDRMPVILDQNNYEEWLGTGDESLLVPYTGKMTCHPVATYVNNPKNEGRDLIEEVKV